MGNNKTKKLKILLLINNLKIGGAEIVFIKLSEYLKKLGYPTFLAITKEPELNSGDFLIPGAITLPIHNLLDIEGYRRIIKFIKQNEIDIIYSTLDYANIISRTIKIFLPSLRVFIRESGTADRKTIKLKFLDIILNLFCNKIIAVSEEVRKTLIAYQPFCKNKIMVINNGIEITMSEEDVLKNIEEKRGDKLTILSVGNMNSENKNQMGLINAMYELTKSNPAKNITLELIGDGFLRGILEARVKALGLENKIFFIGQVDHKEINKFYLSADLFIINSKKEGLSNALLEAMSFGLPVISTKTGGAKEVVINGESGFLIEGGDRKALIDRINKLFDNLILRRKMGIAAYKTIKTNYLLEVQFKKLLTYFKNEF